MRQLNKQTVPTKHLAQLGVLALVAATVVLPELAHASVESSLSAAQGKLTHIILPVCSVIGIAWAAFSFLSGNEKAKTHIWYALIGSAIGFGAQSIVDFISQTVR